MTDDGYRIAVVGATGAVGETVLRLLSERDKLPVAEVVPFSSVRSSGLTVHYRDQPLECQVLSKDAIAGFDIVFSAAGGGVSKGWGPKFEDDGAVVIDKSSAMRMDEQVALVVPEVNGDVLDKVLRGEMKRIIASPNCSTMQMVVALNPLRELAGIREIIVSTYQSVSGTGREAVNELLDETRELLGDPTRTPRPVRDVYPHPIASNVVPQVEVFSDTGDGDTTEELKMWNETCKIFGVEPEDLPVTATCARVPVINCHSESILVETERPLTVDAAREALRNAPGVELVDDPSLAEYPLPSMAAGRDEVFVGRVRKPPGRNPNRLNLWVVGDNLRKGAATNAVQIAEELHRRGLQPRSSRRVPVGSAASS